MSSGRTGSTLISKIINAHKDICIISDLIEPIGDNRFIKKNNLITNKEYYNLINRKTSKSRIYYWRKFKTKELLYLPKNDNDVSLLNCYTLPFLFKNPKEYKIKIEKEFLKKNSLKKKSKHLIDYFNLLKKKTKKKFFVERTGGALHHIDKILNFYPNAKIILNLRDPLETSISMRNYPFFRMYELMQKNKNLHIWNYKKFKNYNFYGKMLNNWYLKFFKHFKKIKKSNFKFYNYESLINNPEETLTEILKFILNKQKLDKYSLSFIKKKIKIIKPNKRKINNLSSKNKELLYNSLKSTISKINYYIYEKNK